MLVVGTTSNGRKSQFKGRRLEGKWLRIKAEGSYALDSSAKQYKKGEHSCNEVRVRFVMCMCDGHLVYPLRPEIIILYLTFELYI